MAILITGSSGQIGTNLALALLEAGHQVYGLDVRPNPWIDRFATQVADLSDASFAAGSLGTAVLGESWAERVDTVVHLAAHAKVLDSVADPGKGVQNVSMTLSALQLARHCQAAIVLASSREVYGQSTVVPVRETSRGQGASPRSPYAWSKLASENLVQTVCALYDLPYTILRLSNVYGRYDCDLERMERVMPLFFRKIVRGEPVPVYGRSKLLDFTYVDDCVDGIVRTVGAVRSGASAGFVLNLASGTGSSLAHVARTIGTACGREPELQFHASREGEVLRYVADLEQIQRVLGYRPRYGLKEGVEAAVGWWREWGGG